MSMIPRSALILGLSGVLPFLWGALTVLNEDLAETAAGFVGPRFVGQFVLMQYGTIILAFMSGVLWGFAARGADDRAWIGYAISVLPALWVFFLVGGSPTVSTLSLIFGYLGLLALDWWFWKREMAPDWWMRLRVLLTTAVVICLATLLA